MRYSSCFIFWFGGLWWPYSPNSVSTHGARVLTIRVGVVFIEVSFHRLSIAQARAEFRLRRQCARVGCRGILVVLPGVRALFEAKHGLRDRHRRSDGFGGSKPVRFRASCWIFSKVSWKMFVLEIWSVVFLARVSWKTCPRISINVSHNLLVLELQLRILHFRGSLAENAPFGSLDLQFFRASRRMRSFWKSGSSVFEEVSQKTLLLEVWIFICGWRLAENVPFGKVMLPRSFFYTAAAASKIVNAVTARTYLN